jgi:hypothetical protein
MSKWMGGAWGLAAGWGFGAGWAGAQNAPPPQNAQPIAAMGAEGFLGISPDRVYTFVMAITVLMFGLAVIVFQYWFLRTHRRDQDIPLHFLVTTLAVVGTMFLFVVAGSEEVISPAFGLFGTVIGYVLGQRSNGK